ncbi:MAG: type II toxin-antitoxin system HigB family toxin [bacterium]|nr:type II toxin-antitoxin system HigB family toxin [bacterium]
MRIIAIKTLKDFWQSQSHKDAQQPLRAWYHEVKKETWSKPSNVKEKYKNASILKNKRVVFNIAGNKYRLVVAVQYDFQIVYIRFIGTHQEYDTINAEII